MESVFNDFQNLREKKIFDTNFDEVFRKFKLYLVTENDEHSLEVINNMENQIKIISVDENSFEDESYFIFCFDQSLVIVQRSKLRKLQKYFSKNYDSSFYFFDKNNSDIKKHFTFEFNDLKGINDAYLYSDIYEFTNKTNIRKNTDPISKFWSLINRCLFGFVLLKSYQKSNYNRITSHLNEEKISSSVFSDADYICLRSIIDSNTSQVNVIFHYKSEKLLIRKKMLSKDLEHLLSREISNYIGLNNEYPYFPKYFGSSANTLFIEFINGRTLKDSINLTFEEKVKILIEIMISLQYLHNKDFVYRDLKPNNIIIDNNKMAVLIDFDRLKTNEKAEHTKDFGSLYAAPEIKESSTFSPKTDIFSIGKIMQDLFDQISFPNEILKEKIINISNKCIEKNMNDRPSLSELLHLWYIDIYWPYLTKKIFKVEPNENIEDLSEKKTIESIKDIYNDNKYSNYWICLAEYDNPLSLNKIGNMYLDGKIIPTNHMKAFHYYTLSSDYNCSQGQSNLGCMYFNGNYVKKDLIKAKEYFTKAAEQKDERAQFNLSQFYFTEGKYQNIQKAFDYLMPLVENNYIRAINKLGGCYLEGKYIKQDIEKAIDCFERTAEKDDEYGFYSLGIIYSKREYGRQNYELAIDYLKKAAEKNFREALFTLGTIYHHNLNDINSALEYYSKAAELNCS